MTGPQTALTMADPAIRAENPTAPSARWTRLREIVRQPKGAIGLSIVTFYALLAAFAPWIATHDPYAQNFMMTLKPPSPEHWFGTDELGRDVFSRIVVGARTSLGIGVGGVIVAFLIGVPLGVLAAYRGGRIDFLTMRAVDVMLSFPDIVFALAVVAVLGANTQNVIFAVGLVSVPIFARTARAVTLSTMAEPYIEGSVSLGCSPARVVLRHILPNIAGVLLTLSSLLFAATLLTASGLGFLGLGAQPPNPEWGAMLGESRSYIRSHPHLATFVGLFLAVSALGFNLLGEALRSVYDPSAPKRQKRGAGAWMTGAKGVARRLADAAAAPASHAPVQARDLRVAYLTDDGPLEVVRGVSLTIEAGRTLAIVGESGSGKSTLLRAIATLTPRGRAAISGGGVTVAGRAVERLTPREIRALRREKIGVVFQDAASALNPVLTIGAQLGEAVGAGASLSAEEVRRRCVALLRDVNISDPEKRLAMYPHQFSGGMKQRIVIAMALAQDPEVLLADEPTSALDVTIQQQILALLREMQRKRGMAMLLVTHDLGLVARYADDVGVMYAGRIVEAGAVTDVFRAPAHPYTMSLRQSAPAVAAASGARSLPAIPGEPPNIGRLPAGCAFRPRCVVCSGRAICATDAPELRPVRGQSAACHFAEEVRP
jgi:peptide/nickel transport system permease protein